MLAANPAASPQATAATATASKPIVKFVPKSVSLFGEKTAGVLLSCLVPRFTQHSNLCEERSWKMRVGKIQHLGMCAADAFKFNGPAPEIIQGRLAMVGFLAGAITEAQTGETLLQQATQLSPGTIAWLLLIVVASLQPITKAAKSEPFGEAGSPKRLSMRFHPADPLRVSGQAGADTIATPDICAANPKP